MMRCASDGSCCTAVTVDAAAVVADRPESFGDVGVSGMRASSGGAIASAMSPRDDEQDRERHERAHPEPPERPRSEAGDDAGDEHRHDERHDGHPNRVHPERA